VAFEQSIEINKLSRKLNAFSLPFLVIYNDTKAALSYFKGFLYDLNQERFLKEKSLELKKAAVSVQKLYDTNRFGKNYKEQD
jgi:hypothetical protein